MKDFNDIHKELAMSYRKDLLNCIEEANQGLLCPHWKEYCYREIMPSKGTASYPKDGDKLFEELEVAYASRPQLSDYESECRKIACFGGKFLFFYEKHYYTLLHIIYIPEKQLYTVSISIDEENYKENQDAYVTEIQNALDEWLTKEGIRFDKSQIPNVPLEYEKIHFKDLNSALIYTYTALKFPSQFLCK